MDPQRTRAPAHHPSIAHCPVDGVFKKNIGGEGEAAGASPLPPNPLPLRRGGAPSLPRARYRRPPSPPSGRLAPSTRRRARASAGRRWRALATWRFLIIYFEPTRARRAPAAAGPGTHPKKKTGGGTLAAPARTRPKREGARGGRGAEALDAPSAAARRSPGLAGRARPSWPPRGRPRPMPTPARRDRTAAGPVRRLTRGRRRGRPTRGRRGRATRRRSCGARPPEARPGAAEPRARLGGRHAARRVCSQRSQRSRAQNAGSARARRPRSRKEASRRGSRSPTAASTRNCVRKGGSMPPFGADRLPLALNSMVD